MMLRRIARVRENRLNSASPSSQRIARCNAVISSVKRCSISSTASLLARKTSRHIVGRSEEHTSELQSLMRISYAVFCLKKKKSELQNQRAQRSRHKKREQ